MESDIAGITEDDLAVRLGMFGNRFKKILNGPISSRKIVVVTKKQYS